MILDQPHLHVLLAQTVLTLVQACFARVWPEAGQCSSEGRHRMKDMNEEWVVRAFLGLLDAFATWAAS